MTTTLTRPSLADIEAAFEALDAEGKFYLLDHLADKAGADLPREVAYQIIENDEHGRLRFYSQERVDNRVEALFSAQREKRLEYIKGEG